MKSRVFKVVALTVVVGFAVPVFAETQDGDATRAASNADVRAMLKNPSSSDNFDRKPTAEDFTWRMLSKDSAANGAVPAIGEGSGKAYYDFRDGLPHPYYIAPSNK